MTIVWDGIVQTNSLPLPDLEERNQIFESAESQEWVKVLDILKTRPDLINVVQPGDLSFNTLLHIAAKLGADNEVVQTLIKAGALRSIQNAFEQTPLDFAYQHGREKLYSVLQIPTHLDSDKVWLSQVKNEFLRLFYEQSRLRVQVIIRPPQLEPLLEIKTSIRFVMWGFLREAKYWLGKDEAEKPKLFMFTGSRFIANSTRIYEVSPEGSKRIR
jgi:hypothetical protein